MKKKEPAQIDFRQSLRKKKPAVRSLGHMKRQASLRVLHAHTGDSFLQTFLLCVCICICVCVCVWGVCLNFFSQAQKETAEAGRKPAVDSPKPVKPSEVHKKTLARAATIDTSTPVEDDERRGEAAAAKKGWKPPQQPKCTVRACVCRSVCMHVSICLCILLLFLGSLPLTKLPAPCWC